MHWIASRQPDRTWRVLDLDEMPEDGPTRVIARGLTEKEALLIAAAPKMREACRRAYLAHGARVGTPKYEKINALLQGILESTRPT